MVWRSIASSSASRSSSPLGAIGGAQLEHGGVEQLLELAQPVAQRTLRKLADAGPLDLDSKPSAQHGIALFYERG